MAPIIDRNDAPDHLFNIPALDFSADLFDDPLKGTWFRLGAWTAKPRLDERRTIEDVIERESLLLHPEQFPGIFDRLEYIGNVIRHLGHPEQSIRYDGKKEQYKYSPFYQFEVSSSTVGEPLVFHYSTPSGVQLFINPDLWLFFELEEHEKENRSWWDPRRGVEAIVQRVINQDALKVIEIRVDYLRKYLRARQMSLLIGHYRHLHLYDPSDKVVDKFVKGEVRLGSSELGAKAILQNWGLRKDIGRPFLQRRLHLWFEIRPQEIDVDHLWAEEPPFDPYTFTLPTSKGPVAPSRWSILRFRDDTEVHRFEGELCDFMTPVYFHQDVLQKYERASGFDVKDDGSVSRYHYWGLVRSTRRIGNELLATAIGDFAEGVPFEEWPHWKQYAVKPPSLEFARVLMQEQSVPEAANSLFQALNALNIAFADMVLSFGVETQTPLWLAPVDSLAHRQLKWVYPATADDDEFLKRATLASTLVTESLQSASLRTFLCKFGSDLHTDDGNPPRHLGSLKLLQRVTLIAALIENFRPTSAAIPLLVKQAEGKGQNMQEPELQGELESLHRVEREEFAPLFLLYDLRTHGGLAHAPHEVRVAVAARKLGLPEKNWHRSDYLRLLNLIAESVYRIVSHLEGATEVMLGDR